MLQKVYLYIINQRISVAIDYFLDLQKRTASAFVVCALLSSCSLAFNKNPRSSQTELSQPETKVKLVNASFYGGRNEELSAKTASGEAFDASQLTAAHRTLPFGTKVRVNNPKTGKSVIVRINDRGPFIKSRELDITRAAAEQIGIVDSGVEGVEMSLVD